MSDRESRSLSETTAAILLSKSSYAELHVDTAKQLATTIAEHTRKALQTKVATVENGARASVVFKSSAFTNHLPASQKTNSEAVDRLIQAYKNSVADAGGYFGYATKVDAIQPDFVVSFNKAF